MTAYRPVFWLNLSALLLVLALIVYSRFFGASVGALFLPPWTPRYPDVGFLTRTFQLLCSIPPIVCAFTFGLLKILQPRRRENLFILCSALVTGGFLINEIFRIHIYLIALTGIPKLVIILIYAMIAGGYGLAFRRNIQSTPYILLLSGMVLLLTGIAVDSLKLQGDGIPSLLEGLPKLFSAINIGLYYWYVCYQTILRSLPDFLHRASS